MCGRLAKMCSGRLKRSITATGYALFFLKFPLFFSGIYWKSWYWKWLWKLCIIYSAVFLWEQDRTALLFLLFPSVLLCLRSWVWNGCLPTFPVQLYQVIAGYFRNRGILMFLAYFIQDQVFTFLGCALVGLAIVSLHWIGFERKHIESQWKWYSSMVFAILAFLVFNMLPELRPL